MSQPGPWAQALDLLPLHAQVHQEGAGLDVGQPGLKLLPIEGAGVTGGGFTDYTTMLPPDVGYSLSRLSCYLYGYDFFFF